jgi:hypothetical protein
MIRLLIISFLIGFFAILNAQEIDSVPELALPVYALDTGTPFFSIADTFYVDSVNLILQDGEYWLPIYEKKTIVSSGQLFSGYPRLVCYAREDNSKVFYKNINSFIRDGVMYDFSLNAGDSTWIVSWQERLQDSLLYVVDSVKYKNCIIGDSTKFMYVRALSNFPDQTFNAHRTTWVEGIGDLYHPFLPTTCLGGTCEFCYESTKFFFDGEWLDVEEDLNCEYLVNTDAPPAVLPTIKVFPNPVSRGTPLNISSGTYQIDEVRLISLASGQEVFFDRFMPSDSRELALPHIPPGVYLVRVRTVTGLEGVEKVVVR